MCSVTIFETTINPNLGTLSVLVCQSVAHCVAIFEITINPDLCVVVCQSVFSMLCHTICPQINLKSALKLSQEAIPHLSVNKGNIVNVSSISGLRLFSFSYKFNESGPISKELYDLQIQIQIQLLMQMQILEPTLAPSPTSSPRRPWTNSRAALLSRYFFWAEGCEIKQRGEVERRSGGRP